MKVLCEYCDSYVETDDNEVCPNCGAPLSSPIVNERTRQRLEKIEMEEKAEAQRKQLKAEKDEEESFELIKNIVLGAAGSGIAGGILGKAIKKAIDNELNNL